MQNDSDVHTDARECRETDRQRDRDDGPAGCVKSADLGTPSESLGGLVSPERLVMSTLRRRG